MTLPFVRGDVFSNFNPACSRSLLQGCQSREAAEAVSEVAAAFPGATVSASCTPAPLICSTFLRNTIATLLRSLCNDLPIALGTAS